MKKLLSLLVLIPIMVIAQTQTENYIKTTAYKTPTTVSITTPDITQANQIITYFDGLGRPIQQIAHQQSGSGKDIVTPIEYDDFGRQPIDYLPYVPNTSPSLDYKSSALTDVGAFYNTATYENTLNPYSKKQIEDSPLNRVLKQAAPGNDWALDSGHEIRFDYDLNQDNEIINFSVSPNGDLIHYGYYKPNLIYKTITKNENWKNSDLNDNTTEEYKDNLGNVILKRTFDNNVAFDTYYVYDKIGNLTYVLPPKFFDQFSVANNSIPNNCNYTTFIDFKNFMKSAYYQGYNIQGGGGAYITIANGVITILFSGGFEAAVLNEDSAPLIVNASQCNLPDMVVGDIKLGSNSYNYYVYIENNKLRISKKISWQNNNAVTGFYDTISAAIEPQYSPVTISTIQPLDDLAFQYKYDEYNRLVEKKLPGKQWEFIVYDKLDRPVATGPAFSPFGNSTIGWLITKYDVLSRVVYTGWYAATVTATTRTSLQNDQNSLTSANYETKTSSGTIDSITAYYTNTVAPTSFKLLTVNYYDDYNFPSAPSPVPTSVLSDNSQAVYYNNTQKPVGLPTGSWVRVLQTPNDANGENSYILYDSKSRPVRTNTLNYLGITAGYTYTDTKIDFSGKVLLSETKHKPLSGYTEIKTTEIFTYSPQDRLLTHTHQINNQPIQMLAENSYDELGQLISKNVGNTTIAPLQKVNYFYNIRGWLTGINDITNLNQGMDPKDLFSFKINYNTVEGNASATKALYNGNISETIWSTNTDGGLVRAYGYLYDNLNRLKDATYYKMGSLPYVSKSYDENLTYDKNGNVLSLTRNGDVEDALPANGIDNLVYTYAPNTNKLLNVLDNSNNTSGFYDTNKIGDDFTYDPNGNLITDKNKGITSIVYNHLNLPTQITFGTFPQIRYIYNALGQKTQKIIIKPPSGRKQIQKITDYFFGFQYLDGVLQFFPTDEGYVKNTGGIFSYVFNYTDHLGNTRLSYQDINNDATITNDEILEENNYYPFGLQHNGYNNKPATNYMYKYNGKELQDGAGLYVYDYGFRQYMPDIGRWTQIDPLAEKFISESPYAYVNNDPLGYSDFDGKDYTIDITRDKNGNITGISISGTVYIQGNGASEKRANELNKFAKDNLKSRSIDGVSISIGMTYKYDSEKKEKDLKQGENLLTFDSAVEGDSNISHINSIEISQEGKKTKFLAGKTGTIYGSGQDNNTVFHESMHLLGLVDRYEDNRDKKYIPEELRVTNPHKGYEKNAMGDSSYTNLNQQQYKSWIQHAVTRSKANNNTNRIIGVLQVDRSVKTGR